MAECFLLTTRIEKYLEEQEKPNLALRRTIEHIHGHWEGSVRVGQGWRKAHENEI